MKKTTSPTRRSGKTKRTRGERNCAWIEKRLRVPDGKDVGKPIKLRDWQRKDILRIYDNPEGTRLAIISVGRKNGKTALAACLLLLHLVGPEALRNTQLYSSALSRDQAALLFNLACKMIRMSPLILRNVSIRETAKQITCEAHGTLYQALSADASTNMGKSPVFIVHDELGQVAGPRSRLYEALETATSAHESPMSIVISTQAPADNDLLSTLIDDGMSGADPRIVVSLYSAPENLNPFEASTVKMANPAFGDFQNSREIMGMAMAAKRMPSREAEFRNLILNQRVEAANPFVSREVWKQNGEAPKPMRVAYGGLDLSEVNDLTAWVLVGEAPKGFYEVRPTFWLPEHEIEERSRRDRVQYDVWAKQGALELAPGRSIEYSYVAKRIVEEIRRYDIRKIAFDRYNMRHLRPWLIEAGMTEAEIDTTFVDFGQGFVSMAPALRALESLLLNGKLRHGMHPVLTMCAANAVTKTDAAGNRKLDKSKSRGRIDGMVALAMATAVADTTFHERHVFGGISEKDILAAA